MILFLHILCTFWFFRWY